MTFHPFILFPRQVTSCFIPATLLGCIELCSILFPHWKRAVRLLGGGQLVLSSYSQSCAPSIERVAVVQMGRGDVVEAGLEAR